MNILIAFATFSSGTLEASQLLSKNLQEKNHAVTLKKISDTSPDEFSSFDLIILGSPSWLVDGMEGMPHDDFVNFFKIAEGKIFENKPFAVYGLGDASYAHFCGAVDHLEEFVKKIKGKLIVESLRIDGYLMDEKNGDSLIQNWVDKIVAQFNQ